MVSRESFGFNPQKHIEAVSAEELEDKVQKGEKEKGAKTRPSVSPTGKWKRLTQALALSGILLLDEKCGNPNQYKDISAAMDVINKDPKQFFGQGDLFRHSEGQDLLRQIAESNPELALKYASVYAENLPKAEGNRLIADLIMREVSMDDNSDISLESFSDKERLIDILSTIESPAPLLRHARAYTGTPRGKALFKSALKRAYEEDIIKFSRYFSHFPGAEKRIQKSFEDAFIPSSSIRNIEVVFKNLQFFSHSPWAREIFTKKMSYRDVLRHASSLKNMEGSDEVFKKAVNQVEEFGNFGDLVRYPEAYEKFPDYPIRFKRYVDAVLRYGYGDEAILESAERVLSFPWGEPIVEKLLNESPYFAVNYFNKYSKMKNAKALLHEAIKKSPWDGVYGQENYKQVPNWEELFKESCEGVLEMREPDKARIIFDRSDVLKKLPWGSSILLRAVEINPAEALTTMHDISFLPGYKTLIKKAAEETDSMTALGLGLNKLTDQDASWRLAMVRRMKNASPTFVLAYGYEVSQVPGGKDIALESAKELVYGGNAFYFFQFADKIEQYSLIPSKELDSLLKVAFVNSAEEHYFYSIAISVQQRSWFKDVAVGILRDNPMPILDAVERKGDELAFFEKITKQDPFLSTVFIMAKKLEEETNKPGVFYRYDTKQKQLLYMINNPGASFEEAKKFVENEEGFLRFSLDTQKSKEGKGKKAFNNMVKQSSLRVVREINDLHERPDAIRYKSIEGSSAEMLYVLLVSGEEEVFTSSFNGIFTRLLKTMEKEGIRGDELMEKVNRSNFRTFVKLSTRFNRFDEFLASMTPDSQKKLLQDFMRNIENEKDPLAEAVSIADTLLVTTDENIISVMSRTTKTEFQRCEQRKDKKGMILYGLLASTLYKKSPSEDVWFQSAAEKYRLPDLGTIKSADLFNPDGTDIQQYFFYRDEDGRNSFTSFMARFTDTSEWKVERQKDHVHIVSVIKQGAPKKVEIFANLPEFENEGRDAIEKKLKERNIKTIIVVHRGHSYHVARTISNIPSIARIVYLGSCGGYNNLSQVLERAPNAHVLSTKGTGTMTVNDPILNMLNSDIRAGKDINWTQFWQKAGVILDKNPDFNDYIPPHENQGVLLIKAYKDALGK